MSAILTFLAIGTLGGVICSLIDKFIGVDMSQYTLWQKVGHNVPLMILGAALVKSMSQFI